MPLVESPAEGVAPVGLGARGTKAGTLPRQAGPVTELVDFGPLTIAFDHRVLRPRPWTIMQAQWAAGLLPDLPPGDVLELCAGAGHIGLLATMGSGRRLVQVDANEVACRYARINAEHAGRHDVDVRHGRLQAAVGAHEQFALVVADPPWVPTADTASHPEDPLAAIDGGDDGLGLVRACLDLTAGHLLPGGRGVLQVGPDQVPAVQEYAESGPLGLRVLDHRIVERGAVVVLARG